jgi:tripartite-type tricarboxylate transporter receptor subunit TctC
MPGLPTVGSTLPDYLSVTAFSAFVPAATPQNVIATLRQHITQFISRRDTRDKLFGMGIETVAGSPEQLAASVKSEMARMGKVIRDAGIRVD